MARVFETSNIRGLRIPNRFVRSATWEGMADPDYVTELREVSSGMCWVGRVYERVTVHSQNEDTGIEEIKLCGRVSEFLEGGVSAL